MLPRKGALFKKDLVYEEADYFELDIDRVFVVQLFLIVFASLFGRCL